MSTIDPVFQASAYQQMLLAQLGDDDPAEVQRETPAQWRALISEAGADLRTRPADGEWSVIELLGHAADAELVVAGRLRWIAAQDEPPLLGYDQDQWVSGLDHGDGDPAQLLDQFEALRRANLALWAWSTPEIRRRVGIHEERGPESFDLTFRLLAGHDRFHVDQARRTLEQVRG
jgi:hypothetical protein